MVGEFFWGFFSQIVDGFGKWLITQVPIVLGMLGIGSSAWTTGLLAVLGLPLAVCCGGTGILGLLSGIISLLIGGLGTCSQVISNIMSSINI